MNFLLKKLLAPKGMEYLVITKDLIIEDMSFGVKRFADLPESVEIGQDCRQGFPELVGMESTLMQVLWGWNSSLELKGICRQNTPPLYVDLFIMGGQDQPNRTNNNLIVFFEDVTERMILEQTLSQRSHEAALLLTSLTATKDYLQKIITAIADALIVTTKSGQIQTINSAAQELFGYSTEELVDQSISQIIIPPQVATESFPHTIEVKCKRKDTSIITVAFSCSIIQTEIDGIENLVYIGRDITEQLQIKENLNLARTQAEEASKSKSLFLANMSHEIRTPMNGVLGLTELLISTNLDPRQRDFAEGIRTSGRNLLTIINEILDFSKLEAGKVKAEVYEFDLRDCVEDIVDLLAPLAHSKGLELSCMIDPSLPTTVWGDSARLGQILTNFLSNAIKFTSTGEVLMEVCPHPETGIIFSVIDQGIGIASQTLNKLFAPFTQADDSTTRKYGGTGLGLAICKQLTKIMGGEIGVESTLEQGSRFWVSFPFNLEEVSDSESSPDLSGYRLLIVDSHATTRYAIAIYARHLGMTVEEVHTKEQALLFLESQPHPDLIIMELNLDFGILPQVDLPLIITTSNTQLAIAQSLEFPYLVKPLRLSRLGSAIQNAIAQKSKQLADQHNSELNPTQPQKVLNILLAEDNLINQKVATIMLVNLGYKVDIATNGEEVLMLLAQNDYDVLLMDCQMPILDGFATTTEIRRREGSDRHTVIIAVTANAMKEDKERCLAAGMDDYLSKPFYKVEIENMLNKWGRAL
jgi:PAS domain S-box-containing protein